MAKLFNGLLFENTHTNPSEMLSKIALTATFAEASNNQKRHWEFFMVMNRSLHQHNLLVPDLHIAFNSIPIESK